MDVPQFREETVEAVTSAPRDPAQQRSAEQTEDVPQFPEETVEMTQLQRDRSWMNLPRR